MAKNNLVVLVDVESTGLDFAKDHIVQLASIMFLEGQDKPLASFESLANPGVRIHPDAAQIHGITNAVVANQPLSPAVAEAWWGHVLDLAAESNAEVTLVAHNIGFDIPMLTKYFSQPWPGLPTVCTLRLARRLDQKTLNHKLTTLVSHHQLGSTEHAHDALADVWMAYNLLRHYLKTTGKTVTQLAEWLDEAMLLPIVPFGKYKGMPFDRIPPSGLRWFASRPTMDPDCRFTASRLLRVYG